MLGATRRKPAAVANHHDADAPENDDDDDSSVFHRDGTRVYLIRLIRRKKATLGIACLAVASLMVVVAPSFQHVHDQPLRARGREPSESISRRTVLSTCSCSTSNEADGKCCKRLVLKAHKQGVFLANMYFPGIPRETIHPHHLLDAEASGVDYRHVVITRPWYDSIVSGYLYHRSGRECWLDAYGKVRATNKTVDWESKLTLRLDPPSNNRSVCSYLAEETEEVGMRAYMDFSVSDLYGGVVPYRELADRLEAESGSTRTLFLCFGDLEDENAFPTSHRRAMEWLYPGQPYDLTKRRFAGNKKGHGTTRNSRVRDRLLTLVSKFDREHFGRIGQRATEMFGCERSRAAMSGAAFTS
jgi:hypothetical protein